MARTAKATTAKTSPVKEATSASTAKKKPVAKKAVAAKKAPLKKAAAKASLSTVPSVTPRRRATGVLPKPGEIHSPGDLKKIKALEVKVASLESKNDRISKQLEQAISIQKATKLALKKLIKTI